MAKKPAKVPAGTMIAEPPVVEPIAPEEPPKPAPKRHGKYRDTRTGEIVTVEYAGQNPGSTYLVADDLPE